KQQTVKSISISRISSDVHQQMPPVKDATLSIVGSRQSTSTASGSRVSLDTHEQKPISDAQSPVIGSGGSSGASISSGESFDIPTKIFQAKNASKSSGIGAHDEDKSADNSPGSSTTNLIVPCVVKSADDESCDPSLRLSGTNVPRFNEGALSVPFSEQSDNYERSTGVSSIALPRTEHSAEDSDADDQGIFAKNVRPPAISFTLPEPDSRFYSTPQLAFCLGLLQADVELNDILDPAARSWLHATKNDPDEQERLESMAMEVIRAFKRDELKDAKVVAEVVCLAPALNKDEFHELLSEFYSGIEHSGLFNFHLLEGLAQLIQGANPGFLSADDLVKILGLIGTRLRDTHQQSKEPMHLLTLAVSHVLDAMADTKVVDLDRETLHEPLSHYLEELTKSSDPYLVYHAAYAYQALLCIPDNETDWQTAMRHAGKMIQGVSGLVSAVKSFDLMKFLEGLDNIHRGLEGVTKVVDAVAPVYSGVSSLAVSGQGLLRSLKEGFSFEHKVQWYSALRGADVLIRDGELVTFKDLIFRAPCRRDPAFQWGVCQRLGEIATNPLQDLTTRRDAITFLGEMYMNDDVWGYNVSVKQWILNILVQLTAYGPVIRFAEAKLIELEASENKKAFYQMFRMDAPTHYPLRITMPEFAVPSLIDRVQNRPDVEGNIRLMRKQRTSERGNTVYIPPQAKSSLQAANETRFPLMDRVKEFLGSKQKVFLLHGDSGAGKSAFSRELELDLWDSYKKKTGCIPLHINLPSIDKPEHDMIGKQLRKYDFTEAQIREMKHYRKFVLICDGYDETQQTHN
ncbi:hypothetical protein BGX34_005487, partial [Mortierella sp. NVP85]